MTKTDYRRLKVGDEVLILTGLTKYSGQIVTIVEIDNGVKWGNRATVTNSVIGTRRYHYKNLFFIEKECK